MLPADNNLLTFLQGQLIESATGSGRTVLVSGDPGSGKTTALRAFVDHAENAGALVLSAAGTPDEQPLRAGVLEQLISNTSIPEDIRQRIGRLISTVASEDIHFIREAGAALLDMSREQPVVIAVDDVHCADHWTVRLLCLLHRRIRSTPVLMLLTRWTSPEAAPSPQAELLDALACRRMRLDPVFAAVVADQEIPVDAMHVALRRWGEPMSEVSRAMAVLGEHADAESVARFVGGPQIVVKGMIAVLERTGLAAGGRFRHPSVDRAILADLPTCELVRAHRRAATVAYRQGRAARDVARHLVAAGTADDEAGWPVAMLREAAEQTASAGDVGFATRCLELALTAVTETSDRIEIQAALARVAWRCAPEIAARNLSPLSDAVRSSDSVTVDDASALVRDALWRGDRETLRHALKRMECADPQTRAEIRLACLWHFGPNGIPPEPGDRTDSPWLRVSETLADGWLNGVGDKAAASAELILRSCRLSDLSLEALAIALCALPDGEQAEQRCARLVDEATKRGAVTWAALLSSVHAMLRLRNGDPAGAADDAAAALRMLGVESWGVAIGLPLSVLVSAHTEAGDHGAAADALRVPVPAAMFGTLNGLRYLHARGRHHLAANRVLAAIGDFQRCQRAAEEWGDGVPEVVPWRQDLASAMIRLSQQVERANSIREEITAAERPPARAKTWTARLTLPVARAYKHTAPRLTTRAHGENADVRPDSLVPELSEAELRVVELAVAGLSNRQISEDLYVTLSTVEQHLTRVYKKLGVAGRSDLRWDDIEPGWLWVYKELSVA